MEFYMNSIIDQTILISCFSLFGFFPLGAMEKNFKPLNLTELANSAIAILESGKKIKIVMKIITLTWIQSFLKN